MKLAVLGSPIAHSLSPTLHSYMYSKLGIAAEYSRIEVKRDDLTAFMETHRPSEWRGFSLTMPLKESALSVVSQIDEASRLSSAVNTLVSDGNSYRGFNTDVFGFVFLLKRIRDQYSQQDLFRRIAILGAGGTARAALVALAEFGSDLNIEVYRRNEQRDDLLKKANPHAAIVSWDRVNESQNATLLINTVPNEGVASVAKEAASIPFLIDSLYSPWPPALIARQVDGSFFSGKDLLVAQALRQIELFLELPLDYDEVFSELRALI